MQNGREGILIASLALAALSGCGVSPAYVGANARTIRTNSEAIETTLHGAVCTDGMCTLTLSQQALGLTVSVVDQITERATAMCAVAAPHCETPGGGAQ